MSASPTSAHLIAFTSLLAADEEAGKLNTRDLQVLALLVAGAAPLTVGQVAEALAISSSHCGRLIDRLVQRGLLDRMHSPTDRRICRLVPTKAGRALDKRVSAHYHAANPATAA